jgi:hypothetical protein
MQSRIRHLAHSFIAVAALLMLPALSYAAGPTAGSRHPVGWERVKHPALPAAVRTSSGVFVPKSLRAFAVDEDQGYLDPEDGSLVLGEDAPHRLPPGLASVSANVRANNTAGDPAGTTNSETSVAALGNNIVAAWNDGKNFGVSPGNTGYAYSSDGGVNYTDGGIPPVVGSNPRHEGDPCVTVDNAGNFYLSDLYTPDNGATSAIAVQRGNFAGTVFTFQSPVLVASTTTDFLDKEWIFADKVNGNVYCVYTRFFGAGGNQIEFSRSTDQGATWDPPQALSDPNNENCSGARVSVGPNHEVQTMYFVYDFATQNNYMRARRSIDLGVSFGSEVTLPTGPSGVISGYGSGPAGFNRSRGIGFPSLAIDNSCGPNKGRVYGTWEETVNFYFDPLGTSGVVNEVENNGTAGTATPITIGQEVHGNMANTGDNDFFSFTGTAGQTVILYLNPGSPTPGDGFLRLFAGGGAVANRTQLSYIGYGTGLCVYTLPSSGTYFFRVLANSTNVGDYIVYTGFDSPNPGDEIGRDTRDAIVQSSPDGSSWDSRRIVNDDAPLFDNTFPEVAVDMNGQVYIDWYDHRNDPTLGINTDIRYSRSGDGSATFNPSVKVNDGPSINWSNVASNLQPNMGDYSTLWADGRNVYANFADGRQGSPDSWVAIINENLPGPISIMASSGPNGSISPSGKSQLDCGSSQKYTSVPAPGYHIDDVKVDGSSVGTPSSYVFSDVQTNHTISVTFAPDPATIGAQSTATYICPSNPCVTLPVTISRPNSVPVLGFSVTIQLSPNLSLCNGKASITEGTFLSSQGGTLFQVVSNGGGSYTVDGALTSNCGQAAMSGTLFNVAVTSSDPGGTGSITTNLIKLRDCSNAPIPANAGPPGTVPIDNQAPSVTLISPNGGESIAIGCTQKISWNATDNSGVSTIDLAYSTDGGATYPNVIATGISNTGTFTWTVPGPPSTTVRVRVTAHDIACSSASDASDADFTIRDPIIVATAGAGGTITPSGSVSVPAGGSQKFDIAPSDKCHAIDKVLVDGNNVGAVSSYTFTNVQCDHTIDATFKALGPFTITASVVGCGSITPSGAVSVPCGGSQTFTYSPCDKCHVISIVKVDGLIVGAASRAGPDVISPPHVDGSYTFSDVQGDHTIEVTFSQLGPFTITASAGPGGSISPNGAVTVPCGGNQTFNITPNACYHIADVKVDNASVGPVASYTFSDVQTDHTISATFAPDLSISIADAIGPEGNSGTTPFVFKVTLSGSCTEKVSVDYSTADGSAKLSNNDYVATSGTLSFAPGEVSKLITVPVNGDLTLEGDEHFFVNLSNPVNAAIGDGQGDGTIVNDDGAPTISISDVSANEGNSGLTVFKFFVSLSNMSDQPIKVDYKTVDGTATLANNDYQAATGTLTIAPKTPGDTIRVNVVGDTKLETDETFTVVLSNAVGASILDDTGVGTIKNDDNTPKVSIGNVSLNEGDSGLTPFVFTISLNNQSINPVTVNWATADGNGNAGRPPATLANNDYVAASGTVTIPPKTSSTTITVNVVGDVTFEQWESFRVILSSPVNATLGTATGSGIIQNDDPIPTISIDKNVSVTEGNTGQTTVTLKVSLSHGSSDDVLVDYNTADGSATVAGNDYVATSGTLDFAPKTLSQTISVVVNGDILNEGNESFSVHLSRPRGAQIESGDAVVTIIDDDLGPQVRVVHPNGGEILNTGQPFKVEWTASDIASKTLTTVDLYVSNDNGVHYYVVALGLPASPGEYAWYPADSVQTNSPSDPLTPVYSALLKVVAHDADGKSGQDVSDHTFAIQNQAKVSVPGGGSLAFGLGSVGPIPAAGPVRIVYTLAASAHARVSVVDLQGRLAAVLVDEAQGPGRYETMWNARADMPTGVYFVRYQVAGRVFSRRIVVTD